MILSCEKLCITSSDVHFSFLDLKLVLVTFMTNMNSPNLSQTRQYLSKRYICNVFMQSQYCRSFTFMQTENVICNLSVRLPLTLAVYALDGPRRGRDISRSRNPTAKLIGVTPAPGPDGRPDGSMQFYGRSSSYVELPNTGRLDARYSITILAWVYHEGRAGPIFNYNPRGFGVHLWMVRPRELFARFVQRSGRFTRPLRSRKVRYKAWNYVGTTYNQRTGIGTLWINSKLVARQKIGKIRLSTNFPVRLGARIGDGRYFRGRLFCIQVYSAALTGKQIDEAKKKCFKSKCALYFAC